MTFVIGTHEKTYPLCLLHWQSPRYSQNSHIYLSGTCFMHDTKHCNTATAA